jgi:competence protein CoiA
LFNKRKAFIKSTTNGEWTLRVEKFINQLIEQNKQRVQKERLEIEKRYAINRYGFYRKLLIKQYKRRRRL